ncbi:Do family serine endopeptidase [Pseudoduganella danionis]|uniref:Probable periplasmic serine endoprotease DegP-like n=1 Tax=Pseudoduganella danionis TaxID=1890295 RepID=A0ABW9SNK7_9BURK|nr:Do family serine endopeptidase [Pseudoduganella danionis]MTW33768.1 Do family serine endopeptidase [Pseudoduganella danionis]
MKKQIFVDRKTLGALAVGACVWFSPAVLGLTPVQAAAAATGVVVGLPNFADLVDQVGPAVVNIRTLERPKSGRMGGGQIGDEEMQEFLRRFFGGALPQPGGKAVPRGRRQAPSEEPVPRGVGSGFILSADGYVMTNAHVIDGADEVLVTLTDKREFKAKVLGADASTDVAVLKIEGANLPFLVLGSSEKIRVGEWVIAIGSPFNLENTVTAGIISAKQRDTGEYLALIQSDVAVNPGNSGGPLINMRGEVIGINSQIATLSGGYSGISFAIPIDEAVRVSEQIKKSGKVTRGRMGVKIAEVSKEVAESLGLKSAQGALVSQVEAGSPADKAGVKPGDIILKFNGTPIKRSSDLPRLVGSTPLDAKLTITLWRQGKQLELPISVADLDGEKQAKASGAKGKGEAAAAEKAAANALGLRVSDLTAEQKKTLGVNGGVQVDTAEGAAADAGLEEGDVLLQVNNTEIRDVRQFQAVVAKLDSKKPAVLLVRRGEQSQFISIRPGVK